MHLLQPPKTPEANFWITTSGNCIDICVLEWCKLFADQKGKHYWGKVVTDPLSFQAALLRRMGLDEATYQEQLDAVRHYRDKFVAHLDDEKRLTPPWLDGAKAAVWFYHAHVVQKEAKEGELIGLPLELDTGYWVSEDEAHAVLRAAGTMLRTAK